eukprot:553580-Prymnesium_polylepis.1
MACSWRLYADRRVVCVRAPCVTAGGRRPLGAQQESGDAQARRQAALHPQPLLDHLSGALVCVCVRTMCASTRVRLHECAPSSA